MFQTPSQQIENLITEANAFENRENFSARNQRLYDAARIAERIGRNDLAGYYRYWATCKGEEQD